MRGAKRSRSPCSVRSTLGRENVVLLHGIDQATHEWDLMAACHNLKKLHNRQTKALLAMQSALTARRKLTPEFRNDLCREVISTSNPIRDMAEIYGVGPWFVATRT